MLRLVALGLTLFAVGCAAKEEEDELTPPSSIFSEEDLEKGHTYIDDEDGIQYTLGGDAGLYATTPDYVTTDPFELCVDERVGALKVTADTVNITLKADVDFSDCPATTEEGVTITKATLKARIWVGCPDGDVEGYDGKTLTELAEIEDDCGEKMDYQFMQNMLSETESTRVTTYEDVTYTFERKHTRITATQTDTGKPCDLGHSGTQYTMSDRCNEFSKVTFAQAQDTSSSVYSTEFYSKLGYRSIVKEDAGEPTWYSSGSFDVVMNNWTGSVTYTGPTAAPTYSVTDGAATVTGTIGNYGLRATGRGNVASRITNAVKQALHVRIDADL